MAARRTRAKARRRPSQRRSRETVDAILDGAARVLERHGYARGTTNRIAERAGVSIGSLYEYFPDKDAIVVALAERELEREGREILAVLEAAPPREPVARVLRRLVEALVDVHARRPALHRILFEEAAHPPRMHACVLRFEESLAHALEPRLRRRRDRPRDPDAAAHLVVQTAESLAHRFVLRGIHDLDREGFVAEATRMLAGYAGGVAVD